MTNLLLIFATALLLAYCSDRRILVFPCANGRSIDLPLITMIIMLSLFCGLRTAFNDTQTYIRGFQNAVTVAEFWESEPSLWGNPLFYWLDSFFLHHISDNYHIFLLTIASFNVTCFVRFIKRYSDNFIFSIMLFFCLGLYVFNFAAMKQTLAMAILTLAIGQLLKKKYVLFYLLVFLAMLFHTYAIMFAILPFFTKKPWTFITYFTIFAVGAVLFTFESTITSFLEYAEELGKEISVTEVFETQSISVFRLAVFSIPPLLSFLFRRRLWPQMGRTENVMINMSILSFLVMSLGLASAGNLFGRSAIYFELGTIVILPWIIQQLFTPRSARMVYSFAAVCYIAFFLYDNSAFSINYSGITLIDFIGTLLG